MIGPSNPEPLKVTVGLPSAAPLDARISACGETLLRKSPVTGRSLAASVTPLDPEESPVPALASSLAENVLGTLPPFSTEGVEDFYRAWRDHGPEAVPAYMPGIDPKTAQ